MDLNNLKMTNDPPSPVAEWVGNHRWLRHRVCCQFSVAHICGYSGNFVVSLEFSLTASASRILRCYRSQQS